MSETNQIFENEYPQENEVLALLEENQYQYKWGGALGTASSVTFSFASAETFTLDQKYSDSIWSYTFVDDDIANIPGRLIDVSSIVSPAIFPADAVNCPEVSTLNPDDDI